ncbi:Gustatory receptor 20, partial [Frankliniella occidentalis]
MKKMYPPAVSPPQSGRDVFGGHGIFEDMQPLIFVMALYGMLPVSFKPLRVSFHPLRSTLIHCVLVTALVVWSAFRLATARLEFYQADTDPLETQSTFTSVVTLVHLSGLAMLPLIWLEARNFRRNETLCASLMAHFPNVRKTCRMARTVALTAALMCLVAAPMTVGVWMTVVTTEAVHWTHVFANHHVVQLEIVVTALNFCLFQCVKNFAMDLCSTMVQ